MRGGSNVLKTITLIGIAVLALALLLSVILSLIGWTTGDIDGFWDIIGGL